MRPFHTEKSASSPFRMHSSLKNSYFLACLQEGTSQYKNGLFAFRNRSQKPAIETCLQSIKQRVDAQFSLMYSHASLENFHKKSHSERTKILCDYGEIFAQEAVNQLTPLLLNTPCRKVALIPEELEKVTQLPIPGEPHLKTKHLPSYMQNISHSPALAIIMYILQRSFYTHELYERLLNLYRYLPRKLTRTGAKRHDQWLWLLNQSLAERIGLPASEPTSKHLKKVLAAARKHLKQPNTLLFFNKLKPYSATNKAHKIH